MEAPFLERTAENGVFFGFSLWFRGRLVIFRRLDAGNQDIRLVFSTLAFSRESDFSLMRMKFALQILERFFLLSGVVLLMISGLPPSEKT